MIMQPGDFLLPHRVEFSLEESYFPCFTTASSEWSLFLSLACGTGAEPSATVQSQSRKVAF